MENKKVKKDEKTLRQMCEEINQKLDETKQKREAFSIAAKQVADKNILMECAKKLLKSFAKFDISTYGINFERIIDIYYCNNDSEMDYLQKTITSKAFQKVLNEFSPEKLIVKEIYCSGHHFVAIVELV